MGLFIVLLYICIGTGLHTDDYIILSSRSEWTVEGVLSLGLPDFPNFLYSAPFFLFYLLQIHLFSNNVLLYDIVKALTCFSCIISVYNFSKKHISVKESYYFSLLFILYPIHEASNFNTISLFYIVTPALVMYAHSLIDNGRIKSGSILSWLASFSSYASPPYVFGLSYLFFRKKEYKKLKLFMLPQIVYIVYYFIISYYFDLFNLKIKNNISFASFFQNYILQIGTFIDASIGPSFWLKIIFSILELSVFSLILGLVLLFTSFKLKNFRDKTSTRPLVLAFSLVLFLSFCMYSLTGFYPQMAFNLGNRVTTFGSVLVSFFICTSLLRIKYIKNIVFGILIFSVLGIADHWKGWEREKRTIIQGISQNKELMDFDKSNQLFVTGNHYSMFGYLGHIEFFPDAANAKAIFKLATGDDYGVSPLNSRFVFNDKLIVDKKFGNRYEVGEAIHIYDSKSDELFMVAKEDINTFLNNLPIDYRHWIQFLDKENWIRKMVLRLMPRLDYIL